MSLKQIGKTVLTDLRYGTLRMPLGAHVANTQVKLREVSVGRNVTVLNSRIENGVVFGAQARVTDSTCGQDVKLGDSCLVHQSTLEAYASMQGESRAEGSTIGRASYLAHRAQMWGAHLGRFSSVGPECLIGLPEHPVDWLTTSPHFYGNFYRDSPFNHSELSYAEYAPVTIGSDVWIGARAIVRAGITIGHGAIIAAGAVVVKDVEPYAIVGGVPAKFIRRRMPEEDAERLLSLTWWDWPHELLCSIGPMLANNDLAGLERLAPKL